MKDLIASIFGYYEPVMTQAPVVITDPESGAAVIQTVDVVASGVAGWDLPWLVSALLFAIVLIAFFRLVEVLFGG